MPTNLQGAYGMPTPDLGSLLQMPSLQVTEEDKKAARALALQQLSIGLMQHGRLRDGIAGGLLGYSQGLQAPQQRMQAYGDMLKIQGNQLGNAKAFSELQQQKQQEGLLSGIANTTASPFEFPSNTIDNGDGGKMELQRGPLAPSSPEMVQGTQQAQARMFQDPGMIAKLLATGMKGSDLTGIAARFDPKNYGANSFNVNSDGTVQHFPQGERGVVLNQNRDGTWRADLPQGLPKAMLTLSGATSLGSELGKMPIDVQKIAIDKVLGNMTSDSPTLDEKGNPTVQPKDLALNSANRTSDFVKSLGLDGIFQNFGLGGQQAPIPGTSGTQTGQVFNKIPPQVQAARDAQAQQVLNSEGNGQKFNPRINDTGRGGVSPQVANLPQFPGAGAPTGRNPIATAASEDAAKGIVETVKKGADTSREAVNQLIQLESAKHMMEKGVYSGLSANPVTVGAQILADAGLLDPTKLARTQATDALLSQEVVGKLKSMGANPSKEDLAFLEKTVATRSQDPSASMKIINFAQSMLNRSIEGHNTRAQTFHSSSDQNSEKSLGGSYIVKPPDWIASHRSKVQQLYQNGTPADRKALIDKGYVP